MSKQAEILSLTALCKDYELCLEQRDKDINKLLEMIAERDVIISELRSVIFGDPSLN